MWGEPLFGYYNSSDPWVVDRHVEMLTMLGVDFLVFDATNAVLYHSSYQQVLKTLDKYQKQGWDVPKVVWFTNSSSKQTACRSTIRTIPSPPRARKTIPTTPICGSALKESQ